MLHKIVKKKLWYFLVYLNLGYKPYIYCIYIHIHLFQDIELSGEENHCADGNPIPVPPRDRKPQLTNKPRHQRKHPLIIPGEGITRTIARVSNQLEIGMYCTVKLFWYEVVCISHMFTSLKWYNTYISGMCALD